MDVSLLWVLCVVQLERSLCRTDHSSREVLPTVVRRCVWSRNLKNEEALARVGSQTHVKRKLPCLDNICGFNDDCVLRNEVISDDILCKDCLFSSVSETVFASIIGALIETRSSECWVLIQYRHVCCLENTSLTCIYISEHKWFVKRHKIVAACGWCQFRELLKIRMERACNENFLVKEIVVLFWTLSYCSSRNH